jgi:hypothetical protein
VLKNVVQVCTLINVLLESSDEETLSLALSLLITLLSGTIKVSREEEILFVEMIPGTPLTHLIVDVYLMSVKL